MMDGFVVVAYVHQLRGVLLLSHGSIDSVRFEVDIYVWATRIESAEEMKQEGVQGTVTKLSTRN